MLKKVSTFLKKNGSWIIMFISILIVLKLTQEVFKNEIMEIDTLFYETFIESIRNDTLTKIMKKITLFGSAPIIILISLISFFILKNKRKAICISLNGIIIAILNVLLKEFVQRKRPEEIFLIVEKGFSFPSGHSMASMAFYGFIIYLITKTITSKQKRYLYVSILSILILLIGFSRIYLGVHYFSDVIAGFFTSIAYLVIFIKITKKYIEKGENKYEKK